MAIVVAPMFYTQIIWGVLFGYMFWGDLPQITVVLGMPLIILSGLYIMYRENKKKVEHAPEF
jgi:drug/metabolite transporter (DMT)-like permease